MSYSFSAQAANKAEVLQKVSAEFDKVIKNQPVHNADKTQAQAAVEVFVGLLRDDDNQDVAVSVSGSIYETTAGIQNVSVNINAALVARK